MEIQKYKGIKRIHFALLNSGGGFVWLIIRQEFLLGAILILISLFITSAAWLVVLWKI